MAQASVQHKESTAIGVTYRSDAVSPEGIHHVFGVLVSEEDFGHVDAEQIVVALFQRQFDGVAEPLRETSAGATQLANVQEHGVCSIQINNQINTRDQCHLRSFTHKTH